MKPVSSALNTQLSTDVGFFAVCWKLNRRDNVVLGFTSHSGNIIYGGVTYQADSGFTPASIASNASLSVDNLNVEGMLDSNAISESDLQAGLYDFAEVEIFLLNYADTSQGKLQLRRGWLGEVRFGRHHFEAEVRGLSQALSQTIGELYSPLCRAKLGDSRCKVSMTGYTDSGAVTSVSSLREFADTSLSAGNGYYDFGVVSFTSGANKGLSMEVKRYTVGAVELVLPMPYAIAVSDSYTITAGCDKRFTTCINTFSNAVNFRGEPHVPGVDKVLSGS